ncbi:MAG TPA: DUF1289 domain-containing protein [Burkholderiales bacterium]|jgi:hypothetical protein
MTESPCVKICVMDADRRYCLGCARTLDEIAAWGGMSEAEQAEVLAQLPARQESSPCRP